MPETSDQNMLGSQQPEDCNAALVLDDGTVFWGRGGGASGLPANETTGEVCFNTALTGYQEILTDPSYAGQIINFTFPHIGNVGTNEEDIETLKPAVKGCILGADITDSANWRAAKDLNTWLAAHGIAAVTGVDTRRLTRHIRDKGFANGVIVNPGAGTIDLSTAVKHAQAWPTLEGLDLAKEVTCADSYLWTESAWAIGEGYSTLTEPRHHVVAMDFGAKRNILRSLAALGCKVTVAPASTSADDILGLNPDGIFLSNGPGDPMATGVYAVPTIKALVESGKPVFGICLGHQMLALALGATTLKMHHGHRGANHPVKNLDTGKVEITSQNHGFVVERNSLPAGVVETHTSLFDDTVEGIRLDGKPVFSVQHHPEASPGPQDSQYLFGQFVALMDEDGIG